MKRHLLLLLALLALFGLAAMTWATKLAETDGWIFWRGRAAGGGGVSQGGDFHLSGTAGQAEAGGPMQGGDYALSGGFWPFSAMLTNAFVDVPDDHWAVNYINRLYRNGITTGCATDPLRYCPDDQVTRAQMAVFLLKGMHYPQAYTPPDVDPTFPDTAGHWAEDWIEALKAAGITSGYPDGTYRPDNGVTRAEMAAFLLKAEHGSDYTPPAVEHSRFSDVPDDHWAKDWIEQLAVEGITSGYPDGSYHPDQIVTRAEMSVFLIRAFDLP